VGTLTVQGALGGKGDSLRTSYPEGVELFGQTPKLGKRREFDFCGRGTGCVERRRVPIQMINPNTAGTSIPKLEDFCSEINLL